MRTVTREEAEGSRRRLLKWAESGAPPRGGQLGEWIYGPGRPDALGVELIRDKQSLTPMAIQRKWKTLCEFPACPDSLGSHPLDEYAARLKPGTVICRNTFGETLTEEAGRSAALLAVLCRMPEPSVKGWALLKITVENASFVHESVRTYFSPEGALNAYRKLIGIDAQFEETIDDYC